MIQMQTILDVADNSGARKVMCIKTPKRLANIGDIIKVSVREVLPSVSTSKSARVKKGGVYNAVVVRTKAGLKRPDGTAIRFDTNSVVLLNQQDQMIGTRIQGPVARELRAKFARIVSLADEVL